MLNVVRTYAAAFGGEKSKEEATEVSREQVTTVKNATVKLDPHSGTLHTEATIFSASCYERIWLLSLPGQYVCVVTEEVRGDKPLTEL